MQFVDRYEYEKGIFICLNNNPEIVVDMIDNENLEITAIRKTIPQITDNLIRIPFIRNPKLPMNKGLDIGTGDNEGAECIDMDTRHYSAKSLWFVLSYPPS